MLSEIKRFPQVQYGEPEGCGKKGPAQYCPVRWLKADWRSARSINWNSNPNSREDGYKVDTPQVPSFWSESLKLCNRAMIRIHGADEHTCSIDRKHRALLSQLHALDKPLVCAKNFWRPVIKKSCLSVQPSIEMFLILFANQCSCCLRLHCNDEDMCFCSRL